MEAGRGLLKEVAERAHLREGESGVEAFLRLLYRRAPLPTAEIARALGWPIPVAAAVRGELERLGLLERRPGGSDLSAEARKWAAEALGVRVREDPLCPVCRGVRIVIDRGRWGALLSRLEAIHANNPPVDRALDQSHGTPETALRRALAMYREGSLEGKAVLILGDDDLVSVAIGLLARELWPEGTLYRRLVVLDLDGRFLAHIARAAEEASFPLETVQHDLRLPLPPELRGRFDTVETDPPYTRAGLELFLRRALEALRPGAGREIFLSFAHRDPAGQRELLEVCTQLGLAAYSIIPGFNRYAGAATLAGSSQFLHLRTTGVRPEPLGAYEEPLYTGQVRPAQRWYRCLGCGRRFVVGPGGEASSIEALRETGCPWCGGRRFRAGRLRVDRPSLQPGEEEAASR